MPVAGEHPPGELQNHVVSGSFLDRDRDVVVGDLIGKPIHGLDDPAGPHGQHRLSVVQVARVLSGVTAGGTTLGIEQRREVDREALSEAKVPVYRLHPAPVSSRGSADRHPAPAAQRRGDHRRRVGRDGGAATHMGDRRPDRQSRADVDREPVIDPLGERPPGGEGVVDPHDPDTGGRKLGGRPHLAAEKRNRRHQPIARERFDPPPTAAHLECGDIHRQRDGVGGDQLVLQMDAPVVARYHPAGRARTGSPG